MTKTLMAGMDLHSNNVMIGIMDQEGRRLKHQKLHCDFKAVDGFKTVQVLTQEREYRIDARWCWLVDGLGAIGAVSGGAGQSGGD